MMGHIAESLSHYYAVSSNYVMQLLNDAIPLYRVPHVSYKSNIEQSPYTHGPVTKRSLDLVVCSTDITSCLFCHKREAGNIAIFAVLASLTLDLLSSDAIYKAGYKTLKHLFLLIGLLSFDSLTLSQILFK